MALQPLATDTDLEARLGRELTPEEDARAAALLTDASALVRSYTRRSFTLVEDDIVTLRPVGMTVRLPQSPVRKVASVVAVGAPEEGVPDLPLPGWRFDGVDKVDLSPLDPDVWVSLPEVWGDYYGSDTPTYRITYNHGYTEVPDDVVAVVCAMVMRTLTSPSMVQGLVSERIGQYNYQMQQGSGTTGAAVRMSNDDRAALAHYRRTASTIQVRP